MKQFFFGLRSKWYTTMVPAHAPLITISERESMRKRRLLSVILFIVLLIALFFFIQSFFTRVAHGNQQSANLIACGVLSLALWINRKGYLRSASLFFLLSALLGTMAQIVSISHQIPIATFFLWTFLLLYLVIAGLILPFWDHFVVLLARSYLCSGLYLLNNMLR